MPVELEQRDVPRRLASLVGPSRVHDHVPHAHRQGLGLVELNLSAEITCDYRNIQGDPSLLSKPIIDIDVEVAF